MKRTRSLLRMGVAVAVGAATAIVPGVARASTGTCTPYALPALSAGGGAGVISMNDEGLYGGFSDGTDGHGHAVYWTHAGSDLATGWTIHQLPGPLVDDFVADITHSGLMLDTGIDPATGHGSGYVYDLSTGTVTRLPSLSSTSDDYDRRINELGVVAGQSWDAHGVDHAVTWSPPYTSAHVLADFGASQSFGTQGGAHAKWGQEALGINDAGVVVGGGLAGGPFVGTSAYARERQWRGAVSPLLEPIQWGANGAPSRLATGHAQGEGYAIDDAGLVVGYIMDPVTFTLRPTAWIGGQPQDLGAPADTQGNAFGLSSGGWAAGGYWNADFSASRAFLWSQTDGFRTLEPPAGLLDSWAHTASDALRQVGGAADNNDNVTPSTAIVWQC